MDFVVKEGGCAIGYKPDLVRQEWRNQNKLQTHFLHIFSWSWFGTDHIAWNAIRTDPHLPLYDLKFMHMDQAGLTAMMADQWKSFKTTEPDLLEPLKPEQFYVTAVGIAAGTLLASVAFAVEKCKQAKAGQNNMPNKK